MIYCFFNKNNSIDQKIMIDQINIISKIKSNGIACLGLGTEVNKLTFNEKINIIELVTKYKNIHFFQVNFFFSLFSFNKL